MTDRTEAERARLSYRAPRLRLFLREQDAALDVEALEWERLQPQQDFLDEPADFGLLPGGPHGRVEVVDGSVVLDIRVRGGRQDKMLDQVREAG